MEISAESTAIYVPQFGWLTDAPRIRVATTFPNTALFDLACDFTFSQKTKTFKSGNEALSVVIPAITGEFNIGAALGLLRRRQLLGGVYISGGVAPIFLQDTLTTYNVQSASIHSWSPVFDLGWRYRVKGRPWGFSASYREGILLGSEAQSLYPRFRSASGGVFVLFH